MFLTDGQADSIIPVTENSVPRKRVHPRIVRLLRKASLTLRWHLLSLRAVAENVLHCPSSSGLGAKQTDMVQITSASFNFFIYRMELMISSFQNHRED